MSAEFSRNNSRVARLTGLLSKPELNGKAVIIESWNETSQRYFVSCLPFPNYESLSLTLSIKRINIELIAPSFDEIYPNANVVKGLHLNSVANGRIHDISNHTPIAFNNYAVLVNKSCSIRGEPLMYNKNSRPKTVLRCPIHVQLENDSDIVELEDINFDIPTSCNVSVKRGKNIVFRRCKFSSLDAGCGVVGPDTTVSFENCFFEDLIGSGLIVEKGGKAYLLNCRICTTKTGIEIRNRGSAYLLHCTISDTTGVGAAVYAKGHSMSMEMCTIQRAKDSGVLVVDGGDVHLSNCHIQDCGNAGTAIEGPNRSAALICNTVFKGCLDGLLVQTGKSDVTVKHSQMIKNRRYGLFVGEDAIGEIIIDDCVIADNRMHDINNDGGPKSSVVRNGTVLAQDGIVVNLARTNPAAAQRVLQNAQHLMEMHLGDKIDLQATALENARVRKMAGVGSVFCSVCKKEEPPRGKFKKCSQCMNACYCSRECQVGINI